VAQLLKSQIEKTNAVWCWPECDTLVSMQSEAHICSQAGSKHVLQLNISYILRQQNSYDLAAVCHMMCHITGILNTQFCCKSIMTAIWFYCEVINSCNKQFGLLCGNFNNLFKDRKLFTCQSERNFNCPLSSAQAVLGNFVFVLQCSLGIRSHEVVMSRIVPSATVIATIWQNKFYSIQNMEYPQFRYDLNITIDLLPVYLIPSSFK